jgi:hypothetical protein
MKIIYKRVIGFFMAVPGLYLLILAYYNNRIFDITLSQIVVYVISMFISIVVTIFFLYGAWLFIAGPED